MTDNEIIKAFECCYIDKPCEECPCYDGKCDFGSDVYELPRRIFDLIGRLQAEKSNLEIEFKAMRGAANSYKAEIERLSEAIYKGTLTTATQLRAEENYFRQQVEKIKRAKAEANKEFIEKIEKIICDNTYPDFDKNGKAVNVWKAKEGYDALDNLLKEKVEIGDNNAE